MESNEIMVSVACITYNHEKYIRKALESFINQKTTFRYEILVHDDASTDGTQEIIKEYADKYPNLIKPILQTENQYSKGIKNYWKNVYPKTKGRYIALCEGDDYWIDDFKLQKQYDELENNDDSVFCVHRVRCVTESEENTNKVFPESHYDECITSDEFMKIICYTTEYFQTSSYFFKRRIIEKWIDDIPDFINSANAGDTPLMMLAITQGNIRFIDEEMSCYRMESSSSFTLRVKANEDKWIHFFICSEKSFGEFDIFTDYKYSKMIVYARLLCQYRIDEKKKNYRALVSPKYKPIWKKLPKKELIYYHILAICPMFANSYKKIKTKK